MAAIKKLSVPFDKGGNMCWSDYSKPHSVVEQEDVFQGRFVFNKILEHSSHAAVFRDGMDRSYYMSQSEFERIIPFMVRGVLEGAFYFHKQGKFYRLRYAEDAVI